MVLAIILFIFLLILCVIDDFPDLPIRTTKLSALNKYYQTENSKTANSLAKHRKD